MEKKQEEKNSVPVKLNVPIDTLKELKKMARKERKSFHDLALQYLTEKLKEKNSV